MGLILRELVLPQYIQCREGFGEFSGFQLKIIQEVVALVVFITFAILFLKETACTPRYLEGEMKWLLKKERSRRSPTAPR